MNNSEENDKYKGLSSGIIHELCRSLEVNSVDFEKIIIQKVEPNSPESTNSGSKSVQISTGDKIHFI